MNYLVIIVHFQISTMDINLHIPTRNNFILYIHNFNYLSIKLNYMLLMMMVIYN